MSERFDLNTNATEHWYVLMVKPQHERTVAAHLAAKGIEEYAPMYIARRQWSDRVKQVAMPLFPGYVFCKTSLDCRTAVLQTTGVLGMVSFGGVPAPVPESELFAIMRMTSSGLPIEPMEYLRRGETVRVIDGPLRGLSGRVLQCEGRTRVVVGIDLLQRSVAVEVDRCCLDQAAPLRAVLCA